MRQLSLTDTQTLVAKLTKSLGERGAARHLNKMGYRSPENCEIRQGHVTRIQAGSWTCFLAPEAPAGAGEPGRNPGREPAKESIPAPVSTPEAAYSIGEPTPARYLERGPSPSSLVVEEDPHEVRQRLRDELEAEEQARQERELTMPPLVPAPGDHTRSEHLNVQRFARPAAVFNRRQAIEIKIDSEGNEETYFGIPKLQHKPPATITRPYLPKSYGGNVVSTR